MPNLLRHPLISRLKLSNRRRIETANEVQILSVDSWHEEFVLSLFGENYGVLFLVVIALIRLNARIINLRRHFKDFA